MSTLGQHSNKQREQSGTVPSHLLPLPLLDGAWVLQFTPHPPTLLTLWTYLSGPQRQHTLNSWTEGQRRGELKPKCTFSPKSNTVRLWVALKSIRPWQFINTFQRISGQRINMASLIADMDTGSAWRDLMSLSPTPRLYRGGNWGPREWSDCPEWQGDHGDRTEPRPAEFCPLPPTSHR